MRVTNTMMTNSILRYLSAQNEALFERQNVIASQRRINKPSDDPLGITKIMDHRTTIATVEQYQKNIERGKTRLDITELTLDLVDDLLQVVRGIAQDQSDGTSQSRQLLAEEVKNLFDQILDLANYEFNNNYMFAGHQTDTAPFSRDDSLLTTFDKYTVTYNGDDGDMQIVVAENTVINIDADGRPIFQNAANGGINVFDVMRDLIVGLENDDQAAISAQSELLDQSRKQINTVRGASAPIMYQLETTENHWENYKPKIEELLSKVQDADITEAVVELKNIELAYQTTIATAARIIQPGLIDFLK
jgi:flagellar hook-associated protein 3 FlgL